MAARAMEATGSAAAPQGGGEPQKPKQLEQPCSDEEKQEGQELQPAAAEAPAGAAPPSPPPPLSLRAEACELSKLATPLMMTSMLQFGMVMVDMPMIGRLGTEELAASALANTYFNCLQHPMVGCATALDTLLSQSYGAKQYVAFGQWSKTGLLLLLLLCLPLVGLLCVAEPLLLAIGQDEALAER